MANPFQRVAMAAGSGAPATSQTGMPATTSRAPVDFTAARGEIGSITTGRITLAMLDLILLGLIGFYVWTKTAQGGN